MIILEIGCVKLDTLTNSEILYINKLPMVHEVIRIQNEFQWQIGRTQNKIFFKNFTANTEQRAHKLPLRSLLVIMNQQ